MVMWWTISAWVAEDEAEEEAVAGPAYAYMQRNVFRSLVQTEDLRSSVVALDGSDGRTQQLAPMKGGWAELATEA